MRKRISLPLVLALTLFLSDALQAQHWVGSWAASQQRPEPQNSLDPEDLRDATTRLRGMYADAWKTEYHPYWLGNVLVRYDHLAETYQGKIRQVREAAAMFRTA